MDPPIGAVKPSLRVPPTGPGQITIVPTFDCLSQSSRRFRHFQDVPASVMAHVSAILAVFILSVGVTEGQSKPTVIALGPNVFRLDAEETVSLTAFKVQKDVQVSVYLQDHPDRKKTYSQKRVTLKPYEPQMVKLKISSSELSPQKEVEEGKARYLYLVVKSDDPAVKFQQESQLLVEPASGFVFIQTDKPIYNPKQTVYIRVIPVDHQLSLTTIPVRVETLNPQGIIVERRDFKGKSGSFITHRHVIIDRPMFGNWTIRASYGKDNKTNSSVQFEVREYVLPIFEVKIEPHGTRSVLPETDNLTPTVTATYVFGKPVKGSASIKISVDFDGKVKFIGKHRKDLDDEGKAYFRINKDQMLEPLELDGFPEGARLIVRADVTERASFHTETEEDQSCMFLRSPYVLSLTRSASYMKPGLVYDIRIDGRYFGGKPAAGLAVDVTVSQKRGGQSTGSKIEKIQLNALGQGQVQTDLNRGTDSLDITVTSDKKGISDASQASFSQSVPAYSSLSNSHLVVRAKQDIVEVGEHLTLELLATRIDDISAINVLLISRGHVVKSITLKRDAGLISTVREEVTSEMVPSIRVVAYYINDKDGHGGEVVSDSAWVDVKDSCRREVKMSLDKPTYTPGSNGIITLTGDRGTLVGISMVDSAVFLLNDRHLLTRKKIFDTLETFDLGCGPGGGKDAADVFFESGLTVVSSSGFANAVRQSKGCRNPAHNRRRRESGVPKVDIHKRMCCREGWAVLNGSSCYDRASNLVNATSSCKQAMFECCLEAEACRAQEGGCSQSARAGNAGGNDVLDMFEINENVKVPVRAHFPESYLIKDYKIGPTEVEEVKMTFPSSITTWMIQGVGISPTAGLCVAEPVNATVFQSFFLDVRLPIKAVRGEQVEVKVTVYNFAQQDTNAIVYMVGAKALCSEALAGERSKPRRFYIPQNGAISTSFPVIPLEARQYEIKVETYGLWGADAVKKQLVVVPKGKYVEESRNFALDPQGRLKNQEVGPGIQNDGVYNEKGDTVSLDIEIPKNAINASCSAHITGTVMGHSVKAVVDGLEGMLVLPTGCGEQTMIRMGPTVYAMSYLTHTNPNLGGVEDRGYKFIQQGYNRELKYRKKDGSFAVWTNYASSTWLTAFVLKVFCQAREFVDIDQNVISTGFDWLSKQQTNGGQYKEAYRVHHREMIGDVKAGVTLTAFVLIALRECYEGKAERGPGEEKAMRYLETQLEAIESPYALSLVTYALVLSGSQVKDRADQLLKDMAVYDKGESTRYWSDKKVGKKALALAVETTSYALLAQLKLGNVKYTHAIINWLLRRRNSKGAFVSTQDTVVGLQAITEYSKETFSEDLDMTCDLTSKADGRFQERIHLMQRDAQVEHTVKNVPIGGKLLVNTKGTGVGQINVKVAYYDSSEPDELCTINLTVKCTDIKFGVQDNENCDVCGQNCKEEEVVNHDIDDYYDNVEVPEARAARVYGRPRPKQRIRAGRQAPRIGIINLDKGAVEDGASKKAVCITACVSSLIGRDTGMSIIDIGLFTGMTALEEDLRKLTNDKIADNFEIIEDRVIIYLNKIPKQEEGVEPLCVKFRARQDHVVGNIQPQSVKVYDYYEPEDASCTEFYRPQEQSGLYQQLCENGKCECVEGHCAKSYTEEERGKLTKNDLIEFACKDNDYVFKIKIVKIDEVESGNIILKVVTANLIKVVKPGGDKAAAEGSKQEFSFPASCPAPHLEIGTTYIIMGKDGIVREDGSMKYRIDEHSFVMEEYNYKNKNLPRPDRKMGLIIFRVIKQFNVGGCATK